MKFDIILPTIGRDTIANAVRSVTNQLWTDWTLQIIGDGIDAQHLSEMNPVFDNAKIRCYSLEAHASYGATARNRGIGFSNAEWIAYIDDDDEWLPHHLSTFVNMANENPQATMLRTAGQSFMMKHKSPRSSEKKRKLGPINTIDILTVGMAHKRDLFLKTPGWQPQDNHDHLLWKHMIQAGGEFHEVDDVTFLFRR